MTHLQVEEEEEEIHEEVGIPKFKGLAAFGFSEGSFKTPDKLKGKKGSALEKAATPAEEEEEDGEEHDQHKKERASKLQRIAGYFEASGSDRQTRGKERSFAAAGSRDSAFTNKSEEPAANRPKGVVFKKHKQENSDLLRQQSLNKRNEMKLQQHSIIKSSLSQSNIRNTFDDQKDDSFNNSGRKEAGHPHKKKAKMELFGEDEEEEFEDATDFQVKKQFEGVKGQRLLELKGRWGFDERFKVDERFKDGEDHEKEEGENSTEDEKRKQMDVLNQLLGTAETLPPASSKADNKKAKKNSVLVSRYDPEVDPDHEIEVKASSSSSSGVKTKGDKGKTKSSDPPEAQPEPIRSSEPATYKTASNLKSLFSEDKPQTQSSSGGFSLLATFGKSSDVPEENTTISTKEGKIDSAPRQFWQANPFKYDSSDDEEDTVEKKPKSKKPEITPSSLPKCMFFFKKNDPRFDGLEDYFLKKDAMDSRLDYDEKRRELKSIVKAKARNAKRKDEKRTLAIKRAIRKKKKYRKSQMKADSGSANAVKLGG